MLTGDALLGSYQIGEGTYCLPRQFICQNFVDPFGTTLSCLEDDMWQTDALCGGFECTIQQLLAIH